MRGVAIGGRVQRSALFAVPDGPGTPQASRGGVGIRFRAPFVLAIGCAIGIKHRPDGGVDARFKRFGKHFLPAATLNGQRGRVSWQKLGVVLAASPAPPDWRAR